jgi:DNA adenine methylase
MKPLIKWTGGKTSELPIIAQYMPKTFTRLVEPFLGGGAVYFNLAMPALVNDFNRELMSFYQICQDERYLEFKSYIEQAHGERFRANTFDFTEDSISACAEISEHPDFAKLLDHEVNKRLKMIAKFNAINREKDLPLVTDENFNTHLQTAITGALYYLYRRLYNEKKSSGLYDVQHIAYWFIMRELAYSGMFRHAKNGNFNVPYGGMSYNSKNLLTKLERIEELRNSFFFLATEFNVGDFEAFFQYHDGFKPDDFIFLDPPYDSEFSQYNLESDFTQEDQTRLRDVLLKTPARFMMVIKETDFIRELYRDFRIEFFDKHYSVNFQNRNQRAVRHLVIMNYTADIS